MPSALNDPENRSPVTYDHVSNPGWVSFLVILTCLFVWAVLLPGTFSNNSWIYSWDSAAYIETANSLLAGRGLMQRVIQGLGSNIWEPTSWWPPGYSLLTAAVHFIGLPMTTSCVVVSVSAGACSVILLTAICLRIFHWTLSLPLVITIVVTLAFQKISTQCMSDSAYFAFAVASVACVMQWARTPQASLLWIFAAGLSAGAAWATRYVGAALYAATGVFLLSHLLYWRFGHVFKSGLVWLAGVAVCSLPIVVHNLVTFGRLNPYRMPPSELSLWANARRTVIVILQDMTTSAFLADWLVDKRKILFFALATVALVASWIWRTSFHRMEVIFERQKLQIFLLAYATIYTGMVIAARTKYRWGEEIDPRHMVQIYWILWICMAVWGIALFKYCRVKNNIAKNALLVVFLLAIFLQINRDWEFLTGSSYRSESIENRIGLDACAYLEKAVSQNQIVLSTRAELLRVHCDINARKIPPISQYDFLSPITRDDIIQIGQSSLLWGLVIEDVEAAKKGEFDTLVKNIVERPEDYPELQRVSIESPALILRFVGKGLMPHDQVYQIPHVD